MVICVPSGITEVEERAVIDAGIQAGARRVYLIEEPVAAAIGAGIDIAKPDGHMVVDIGGGTADIAVISLGGVVESASIKIAGDKFDEAVVKYIRRKHNVLIGDRTAEELKMTIGCVFPRPEEVTMEIKGRCLMTGLPRVFSVSSSEMIEAFEEPSTRILEAIHGVLERTPPELVADISTNGIVMTGGGSLVWGFDKLVESHTGIETHVADDAISCVAYGTGKSLDEPGPHAGRDHEPVPPQADELLMDADRRAAQPGGAPFYPLGRSAADQPAGHITAVGVQHEGEGEITGLRPGPAGGTDITHPQQLCQPPRHIPGIGGTV